MRVRTDLLLLIFIINAGLFLACVKTPPPAQASLFQVMSQNNHVSSLQWVWANTSFSTVKLVYAVEDAIQLLNTELESDI